ncbi:MAG: hypothetical protein IKB55_06295 [Clostridia bacterium]|nr:hypothetical protein [Clostridia bacterium]
MRKSVIYILIIALLIVASCFVNNNTNKDGSFDSATTNVVYNPTSGDSLSMYAIRYDTLNPLITAYSVNRDMLSLVFDPLVSVTQNYVVENKLAENFVISNGGKTITLYLRKNVTWHDGSAFTAKDVDYTINQILNYPEECIYKTNLHEIENTRIINDTTYEINLSNPNAGFVYLLDFPVIQFSQYDIIDTKDDFYVNGTGKYRVAGVDKFASVSLEANSACWQAAANIKQVNFRLLPDEEASYNGFALNSIDAAVVSSENASKYNVGDNIGYKTVNGNRYTYLTVNHTNSLLADVRLRKLIKRMAAESSVITELMPELAVPAASPVNPYAVQAIPFEVPETNIKEELDALGFKQGDNGVRSAEIDGTKKALEFTMLINQDTPSKVIIGDYIVSTLAGYGISVIPVAKPEEEYKQAAFENIYDFVLCETKISPDNSLEFLIGTDGALNFYGYSNTSTDNIIAQVATRENVDVRNALLGDLQQDFYNNMPHIPLYFSTGKVFYNADLIDELSIGSLNSAYSNINTWSLK